MICRRSLFLAVLAALALALAGALCTTVPDRRLPAIALGSLLAWRAEVAAVLFTAGYAGIVTARLAFHGHTFTRVGSGGVEIPPVGPTSAASRVTRITTDELARSPSTSSSWPCRSWRGGCWQSKIPVTWGCIREEVIYRERHDST